VRKKARNKGRGAFLLKMPLFVKLVLSLTKERGWVDLAPLSVLGRGDSSSGFF
jgi:hypothetical protein